MSGGANIVEQYAGADVPVRIELLIKYYPNFIRLVEGYEQSLSFIIKEEGFYTTSTMTVVYIIGRINWEGYIFIENPVFLLLNRKLIDAIYDTKI